MHVRGSYIKYKNVNRNQKLIAYFLHDGCLWSWTDLDEKKPEVSKGAPLKKVCCTVSSTFEKLDEHTFFVLHNVHEKPVEAKKDLEKDESKAKSNSSKDNDEYCSDAGEQTGRAKD